jgi:hypothetical protein
LASRQTPSKPVALVDHVVIRDRGVEQEDARGSVRVGNGVRVGDKAAEGCSEKHERAALAHAFEHAVDVGDDVFRALRPLDSLAAPSISAFVGTDLVLAMIGGLEGPDHADTEFVPIRCPPGEVDDRGSPRAAAARISVVAVDIEQAFDGRALVDGKLDPREC